MFVSSGIDCDFNINYHNEFSSLYFVVHLMEVTKGRERFLGGLVFSRLVIRRKVEYNDVTFP